MLTARDICAVAGHSTGGSDSESGQREWLKNQKHCP